MTLPLLAGSALNRASCASPTVSKVNPTAHDSDAEHGRDDAASAPSA